MQQKFYLTEKLPPYIFNSINKLKDDARSSGINIIDFGMGNPDLPPTKFVKESLAQFVQNDEFYKYAPSNGIDDLRKALCSYYKRRFNVSLDYSNESIVTIGSKEGMVSLATAISRKDNYVIVPSPCYPIHKFAFEIAGGSVVSIDAFSGNEFLSNFKNHVNSAKKNPIAVLVNYPSNPTSQTVGLDFYEDLISFCKKKEIYIISDIAYAEIYFQEKDKPYSIFQVDGAKDIAIEFSSTSKTYSMAGCRVGFAVGNKDLIASLTKIKSYLDYGSFSALQMVASRALLEVGNDELDLVRKRYYDRAIFLVKLLDKELNWKIEMPKASMFLWAKIPDKFINLGSFEFCKQLIEGVGVALAPGISFGDNSDNFVRFSLIHDEENMKRAVNNIKNFFNK